MTFLIADILIKCETAAAVAHHLLYCAYDLLLLAFKPNGFFIPRGKQREGFMFAD